MQLVFSDSPFPSELTHSIFLAGPTPRTAEVRDWRHEAVAILGALGYTGTVFIPNLEGIFRGTDAGKAFDYDTQVEWECRMRKLADTILFWVPRDIAGDMPAFTTNIEFGEDLATHRVVYGRPVGADKCSYMDKRCSLLGMQVATELSRLLEEVVETQGSGSLRRGGEVHVPRIVWDTPTFQQWYASLKQAGNTLMDAEVKQVVVTSKKAVFGYTLKATVWVAKEGRAKAIDWVFARTDIVTVVPYFKDGADTRLVLIKEFRVPVNNSEGYIYEFPGGSSPNPDFCPNAVARTELHEECGLYIDDWTRFKALPQRRQSLAPFACHLTTIFALELTAEEYASLAKQSKKGVVFGEVGGDERTSVVLTTLKELASLPVDLTTLGVAFDVFQGDY